MPAVRYVVIVGDAKAEIVMDSDASVVPLRDMVCSMVRQQLDLSEQQNVLRIEVIHN